MNDDIAMLVEYAEIARVKPTAFKAFAGGFFVLEITLHHDIAA